VLPTQPVKIPAMFLRHFVPLPSADVCVKFYGDRPRGTLRRELNARKVAKYSIVEHIEGYISETVQDPASDTINH